MAENIEDIIEEIEQDNYVVSDEERAALEDLEKATTPPLKGEKKRKPADDDDDMPEDDDTPDGENLGEKYARLQREQAQQTQTGAGGTDDPQSMDWVMQQLSEVQRKLSEREAQDQFSKQVSELQAKKSEAQSKLDILNKKKQGLLSDPKAYSRQGGLTPQAAQVLSKYDAEIPQAAIEVAEVDKEIKRAESYKGVSQAAIDWTSKHAHWLSNPQYQQMQAAVAYLEEQFLQNGEDPNSPAFYQAIEQNLSDHGFNIPAAPVSNPSARSNIFNGKEIKLPSNLGAPALPSTGAPRPVGQPTTVVGSQTKRTGGSRKVGSNWSQDEKWLADELELSEDERKNYHYIAGKHKKGKGAKR